MMHVVLAALSGFAMGWLFRSFRKPWLRPTLAVGMTPVQRFVLAELSRPGSASGRDLRLRAEKNGMPCTAPEFYEQMSRMEDRGHVERWDEETWIGEHSVQERRYRKAL